MILYRALEIVGKMLRDNSMGDIGMYPPNMIRLLSNGLKRDPEGKEYVLYFLSCAIEELRKEEKI